MASVYTNDLRLEEIGTGEQTGTWGTTTNTNLELIAEAFSYGTEAITTNADTHATVIADGATDEGRSLYLKYTGTLDSACTITISAGSAGTFTLSKVWVIENATSGSQNIVITSGSGADVTIKAGQTKMLYTDGAGSGGAVVDAFSTLSVVDLFVDDDLKLQSDAAILGFGADNDVTLTHVADTGLLLNSTRQLQFGDSGTYIHQSADGVLDLVSDTEIEINATTIDINGNVDISGTITIGSAGISEAELEVLDGLTVSTTEVNILDGDTSATSTTVADADRVVFNDAGTMKQVAVTDLAAYFDDEITAMPNLVTTAATTVGALNSGSITSGFGTIDTGSSTITTTGLITGGSLDIDDVLINGSNIGHTDDTDLITLANGVVTVAGEISVTTLDIGGTNVTSTAAELNILDGVTSTATELNIMDGDTTATSTTLADADRVVVNDAGTMKQVALTDFETYFESALDTLSNVTSLGTLTTLTVDNVIINGSTIGHTGDTDLMTVASGVLTVAGEVDATSLDISGDIDVDGTTNLDNTDIDGTLVVDGSNISLDSTSTLNIDNSNTSNGITIGTATSGVPVSIGHSTSEVTVNDNLTVTGDLTVNGATTTVDTTNLAVKDTLLGLNQGASSNSNDVGIIIERGSTGNDALFMWDESADKFALGTTTDNASSTGNLNMTTGTLVANIEGNVTGNVTGNTSGTAATVTGAAQSNITSLGTLTTLTVDNVIINGTTIGHTDDTDLITLADGIATVAGEISVTTLDIGGTNVAATAAELNIMDGNTAASSTTLADADRLVTNDDGTMKQVALTDVKTYLSSAGFTTDDPTALAIALG
jgi:hypothetical protein